MTLRSHLTAREITATACDVILQHLNDLKSSDSDKILHAALKTTVFGDDDIRASEILTDVQNVSEEVYDIMHELRQQLLKMRAQALEPVDYTPPPQTPAGLPEDPVKLDLSKAFPAPKPRPVEGAQGTWSHCGDPRPHPAHFHDVVMNEGPYRDVRCLGTW